MSAEIIQLPQTYFVLCSGCRRPVGTSYVEHPLRNKIYHDEHCMQKRPPLTNASRDNVIAEAVSLGQSVASVAKAYGLSRQRVHAIVKSVRAVQEN
jgi:hypothetical protein